MERRRVRRREKGRRGRGKGRRGRGKREGREEKGRKGKGREEGEGEGRENYIAPTVTDRGRTNDKDRNFILVTTTNSDGLKSFTEAHFIANHGPAALLEN